jgi:hypothetical protein
MNFAARRGDSFRCQVALWEYDMRAARFYRYLQGCDLSPALRSYVTSCLRQLAVNNLEIRVDEPFRPGALREPRTLASPGDTAQKAKCPTCHMVHAGACL